MSNDEKPAGPCGSPLTEGLGPLPEPEVHDAAGYRRAYTAEQMAAERERAHNVGFVEASRLLGREVERLRAALRLYVDVGFGNSTDHFKQGAAYDAAVEVLGPNVGAELERERMRLAACGVVALANTPDSAAYARNMHPDYRSASCDDVARMVDVQMQYRAALMHLRAGMADAKNTNIVDYIDAVLGAA